MMIRMRDQLFVFACIYYCTQLVYFVTVHARPFPYIMASEPSAQPKNVSAEHWKVAVM